MSGTIMPVKDELLEIYNLPCASLPTHKPLIRKDLPLRIFKTAQQKDDAIIKAIIDNKYDMFDLFMATFTAGTMTGAPKIRAMELIAYYEARKMCQHGKRKIKETMKYCIKRLIKESANDIKQ
jgi:hypothetical protein